MSFEMVRLKNYFVKMFLGPELSHRNKYCYGIYCFTTFVNFVDMIQSMNGIIW